VYLVSSVLRVSREQGLRLQGERNGGEKKSRKKSISKETSSNIIEGTSRWKGYWGGRRGEEKTESRENLLEIFVENLIDSGGQALRKNGQGKREEEKKRRRREIKYKKRWERIDVSSEENRSGPVRIS